MNKEDVGSIEVGLCGSMTTNTTSEYPIYIEDIDTDLGKIYLSVDEARYVIKELTSILKVSE